MEVTWSKGNNCIICGSEVKNGTKFTSSFANVRVKKIYIMQIKINLYNINYMKNITTSYFALLNLLK